MEEDAEEDVEVCESVRALDDERDEEEEDEEDEEELKGNGDDEDP